MICFDFSPEQEQFRRGLRTFAEAELAPRYLARAAKAEFPWDAHRQLAGLGVLGLGLPEKYGGTGEPDPITLGLATEALAYGDVNVGAAPVQVGHQGEGVVPVQQFVVELISKGLETGVASRFAALNTTGQQFFGRGNEFLPASEHLLK